MAEPRPNLTREDIANLEVGVTDITPRISQVLAGLFFLLLLAVPILQQVLDDRPAQDGRRYSQYLELVRLPTADQTRPGLRGLLDANQRLLDHVKAWETAAEDRSFLKSVFLGPLQSLFCQVGLGNEKAWLGNQGWLYFRPDVDVVVGRAFNPAPSLEAIREFHSQLAARGIALVVMPVPSKAGVVTSPLGLRAAGSPVVLHNASYARWKEELDGMGIPVFESGTLLSSQPGGPEEGFLKTDTHWRPAAMESVAEEMGRFLSDRQLLPRAETVAGYNRVVERVENLGDIAVMLNPPQGLSQHAPETVTIHPVRRIDGSPWTPTPQASILLLGDSFANIYSEPAMKWGAGAGLAEQLSFVLQRPLDVILQNDNGSHATREILSQQLVAGVDRLQGKKVVVWEFAARELGAGSWHKLPMTLGRPEPVSDEFWSPADPAATRITARVAQVSPVPKPGSVAYSEHVRMVLLKDLRNAERQPVAAQALAYVQSMAAHRWTAAGTWKPGDWVTVDLQPWSQVERKFGTLNRSELSDDAFLLAEPLWATPASDGPGPVAPASKPHLPAMLAGLLPLALVAVLGFLRDDRRGRRA